MLNIMERFPLGEMGHNSVRALHTMIEAKKLAYADMIRYDADPRFAKIPVEVRSKDFATARATDRCRQGELRCAGRHSAERGQWHDVSLRRRPRRQHGVADPEQLLDGRIRSGLVVDGAGFVLHNRGGYSRSRGRQPNVLAGRKRPVHTIIPAFMQRGDVSIAFGIMGGWNQAQAHAHAIS